MALTIIEMENEILRLVAQKSGETVDELRTYLRAKGDDMPIDSQRTMETLADLDANLGIDIPANLKTERACKSVHHLAAYLLRLHQQQTVRSA